MDHRIVGEFLGTCVLILLGNGVVAAVLLAKSKAENAGWMVIATGWGLAVMAGIFTATACGSPDANLNPAVTLGSAVSSGDFSKFLPYVAAQLCGAFLGAILVWLFYGPHWAVTQDPELKRACFCTSPAIYNPGFNILSEIIGTFMLVFVASAIGSKAGGVGPAPGLTPVLVGGLVWSIGLSLGATTGYAINPARDFAPRLAHAILPISGKGDSDWRYSPIPIAGPLIGAALAGLLVRALGI